MAEGPKTDGPVVWVLGGPGSGKGTQCERIVAKYGFTHLSSGDLLRAEVASGTDRGKKIQAIIERGELVPLDIVLDLIREAMKDTSCSSNGYLIDGYPREKEQGVQFELQVAPVSIVLFFEASAETLMERLLSRGRTSGRSDDKEDVIKSRLEVFNKHNDEIVAAYSHKMKRINAERPPDDVFADVVMYLDPLVK